MSKLVEVIDLYKSYGEVSVLKGLNLTIEKNEFVSIVGISGSGKTTLLNIVGTLDRANKGRILFDGRDINRLSQTQVCSLRREMIGFIFQFHNLLPEFSLLENVLLPALIRRAELKVAKKEVLELLERVGLDSRLNHRPNELSAGESQRVAVVRALVNSPELILADEPTGNLDPKTAEVVFSLLVSLVREKKKTLVLVTHNEVLAKQADRIFRLEGGKLFLQAK